MTNKDMVLSIMRENGKNDAISLRNRAVDMDDTSIIAEEHKIPNWDGSKDYTSFPVGSPVTFNGNVFGLLQPHNAAHYPSSTPENSPAIWSVKHTKDPTKAKPYLAPNGTSGLYFVDECCLFENVVYRSTQDNNPYSPAEYGDWWEVVG